jgi:5-methylcytosine-specific restriction endonuclease McrA
MKINRESVFKKCNGKCGYCGVEITLKQMQVDHIIPVLRGWKDSELTKFNMVRGTDYFDNLLPTCRRCNKWKGSFSLDQFRKEIELQLERLKRDSPGYRLSLDYGLIIENKKSVNFFFETITNKEK